MPYLDCGAFPPLLFLFLFCFFVLQFGLRRFPFCVAFVFLPRRPECGVRAEPEASFHPDLMPALAKLIALASQKTQLWITTHSEKLADEVAKLTGAEPIKLEKIDGETKMVRKKPPDN